MNWQSQANEREIYERPRGEEARLSAKLVLFDMAEINHKSGEERVFSSSTLARRFPRGTRCGDTARQAGDGNVVGMLCEDVPGRQTHTHTLTYASIHPPSIHTSILRYENDYLM